MTHARVGHSRERSGLHPPPRVTYSTTELSSGRLLPIEARLGKRVLRFIPAESDEGRDLIAKGRVEIVRDSLKRPFG